MTVQHVESGSALAIREDQTGWTPQQIAALRHLGAEAATEGDLQVFFHQSQRTGLDPFARQIYLVGREQNVNENGQWHKVTKFTIQTGIDGFRLIARRASDAAREPFGYEDTLWCDQNGRWTVVWLSTEPPAAAKVTVIRNGQRFPAIATFREYAGTKRDGSLTKMWAEKGALMIAKCAEALALRKAFPQDLSGLYTSDEMAQATAPARHTVTQQRVGREDLIAQAEAAAGPVDWIGRVQACETLEELRAVWAAANTAGALDDELRGLVTAAVADLQQVDPQTGEVAPEGYDDGARLAGEQA